MRLSLLVAICIFAISNLAIANERTWTVQKGDTLTSIAKRHGVKVKDLRRWNGITKDILRPGDKLRVGPPSTQAASKGRTHRIRKGETLARIAKREGVEVADILKANPGLSRHRIRAGQEISIPAPTPGATAEKVAAPSKPKGDKRGCPGRIVQIKGHPYYKLRSKAAGWVTHQTYAALKRGFDQVRAAHRWAPRVHVLDASLREGGPVSGHLSHQTGHDIDITYYQRNCPRTGCPLQNVTPKQLDARRQWTILSHWIRRGDVQLILVDYDLQKVLYEHARKRGVSKKRLSQWLQYPRPRNQPAGIIQHYEAHKNHVHVRFKPSSCPNGCCRAVNTARGGGSSNSHMR